MPPLIIRWNDLRDDDKNLLPLLECLTSISAALGSGFMNFALPVFQRCIRLIESTLIQEAVCFFILILLTILKACIATTIF